MICEGFGVIGYNSTKQKVIAYSARIETHKISRYTPKGCSADQSSIICYGTECNSSNIVELESDSRLNSAYSLRPADAQC